jgi:hypothetical protein
MTISLPKRAMLCSVWLLAATAGAFILLKYEGTAGSAGNSPGTWPDQSIVQLDSRRSTLLMFAHPKCPCTRASIEELNRVLATCGERITTHVFFFKPRRMDPDWVQTDLHESAAAIPGVEVHFDLDGALARQFGAETSGHVVLYNANGELLFRGGITGSRGHVGDNASESALVTLLEGQDSDVKETAVYGCSLLDLVCLKGTTHEDVRRRSP